MTTNASARTALTDRATSLTLIEPGHAHTETYHPIGARVPRLDAAYWQDRADFDFVFRCVYTTTGEGPFSVELWAANGAGVPDAKVAAIGIPTDGSGEVRGLVCSAALGVIDASDPLYLSAKLVIGDGAFDCGVYLERAD